MLEVDGEDRTINTIKGFTLTQAGQEERKRKDGAGGGVRISMAESFAVSNADSNLSAGKTDGDL